MEKTINITLKVWRQKNAKSQGAFETYQLDMISTE
jgi:succinate dehydrogenase / fumarate reductase iron-sulfur subunit